MANFFTFIRLLLIPLFLYLFLFKGDLLALLVFIAAILTDWLDGLIARKLNQVTAFGQFFDPFIDRILILIAIFALYLKERLPLWALVLIFSRDVIIMLGYVELKREKLETKVSLLGKIATLFIFIAFIFLIANIKLGLLLFYLALIFYLISAIGYIKKGFVQLKLARGRI